MNKKMNSSDYKNNTIKCHNDQRGRSRTAATSKMEAFLIIVNDFQPLTIITKCTILDVAAVLDPPLDQEFALHLRMTCALTFVSPEDVITLFEQIINIILNMLTT